MRCKFYRRKISAAIDSAAPMSGAVNRHLLRCAGCREFAADLDDLGRRLAQDTGIMIASGDQALAERIKARLGEPADMPVSRRVADRNSGGARESYPRISAFRLRPILAVAAAWVVIGASVIWMVKSRPRNVSGVMPPFQIEQPGKYLVAAMERVNSPYEQEMQLWKQTLDGAARKLESAFDIGLGE